MRLSIVFTFVVAVAFGPPSRARAEDPGHFPEPRPLGNGLPVFQAPSDPEQAPEAYSPPEEPQGSINLHTALTLALARSPELAVFSWNVRAVEARTLQAGLRPNPEILAEIEDVAGTGSFRGFDQGQATVTLSQLIELGGKRTQRLRNAALERNLAGWDYEAKRIDVFTATAQSFIDVLAEQERLVLAAQAVDLARQVVGTVSDRVKAGSSSPAELTKAEVALGAAEIEREQTSRALAAARQRLVANWGSREPRFERVDGKLGAVRAIPTLADLRQRLGQNPDLARWGTEIVQRQAIVALERSRAVPDVTIGAGYRRLAGPEDSAFVAELSIPLPVFNRNQGAVLEAHRRLAQARGEQRSTEVRLSTELSTTYEALAAAYAQSERLKATILPGAEEAFDTLRAGYREGRFSYLDVLDAQRTLVAARAQHVRALAEYHQAVTAVERLIGESLAAEDSTLDTGRRTR